MLMAADERKIALAVCLTFWRRRSTASTTLPDPAPALKKLELIL